MSGDEDDYLSDKFLFESAAPKPSVKTYSAIRKEAHIKAHTKQEQNKLKSRRERELESRQEALSTSLFQDSGTSSENKALAIMMKMGFKPGESLGKKDDDEDKEFSDLAAVVTSESTHAAESSQGSRQKQKHRTEPIPLNEWTGKKGIGLGTKRRARSPSSAERVMKMAKMAVNAEKADFRERSRREYHERNAEGRLHPAQRTCATLDEKAGKDFNVLWLNPEIPQAFPEGLIDALTTHTSYIMPVPTRDRYSIEGRLRQQMQNDALRPLENTDDDKQPPISAIEWSQEILEECAQFLRLQAQDRLQLVLSYLRRRHHYCFWCGLHYSGEEEMDAQCPGETEDDHD